MAVGGDERVVPHGVATDLNPARGTHRFLVPQRIYPRRHDASTLTSMTQAGSDAAFVGAIPDLYDRLLVPMIFAEAAGVLADTVAAHAPSRILETAAGTGALTRALLTRCPDAEIVATDLNPPMLERAAALTPPSPRLSWQPSDALDLPFPDASFDVVACQFGVMFFPDRARGYAEARRLLGPRGTFVFNVWDRIENNEVPWVIERAINEVCTTTPLHFMSRTPHGYHDPEVVTADLVAAGLPTVTIEPLEGIGRTTAHEAAQAFCFGTPLRGEIERHPDLDLPRAAEIAEAALLDTFGPGQIDGRIRSFVVTAATA